MAETNPSRNFTSETTDDCNDDARTEQNRAGAPTTDGSKQHAESKSRDQESSQPPVRDAGDSVSE